MDGKELRKLRNQAGMTQSELASRMGYFTKGEPNRSMISRFENGFADINPRVEAALLLFLRNDK